jgi:hypothetical protein
MPSTPAKGPRSINTRLPNSKKGHGIMNNPDCTIRRTFSISSSGTGAGILPKPTKSTTPGAVNTGNRSEGFSLQNT